MKEMTPKERAFAFFRNEPYDEVPSADGIFVLFNPEGYQERPPFSMMQKVGSGKDWWGVEWKYEPGVDAQAPDHTKPPVFEYIEDWREAVTFPDIDNWDWEAAAAKDAIPDDVREKAVYEIMFVNGPFERLHMLMGFENALCALVEDPEECEAFFNAFMEWKIKLMEKVITYYKPDVLMFHDDWGTQNAMFFSPEVWRSLIKPQIKKAVDRCHEMGCLFEMHSCGKMEEIVPDFVELGIDSWQGMEINDIPKLKEITGNKLGYHVTPDYQKFYSLSLAGELDEAEVKKEIEKQFLACAKGYCYYPMFLPFGGHTTEMQMEVAERLGKICYKENLV